MRIGFLLGVFVTLAALGGGFYLVAATGHFPANADSPPPAAEKWIAKKALNAAIARLMDRGNNPVPVTDANLIEGIHLYAKNCAVCHGGADAKPSNIAVGLYQKAPQLARYGVEDDDDGAIQWQIAHGIRLTGMPAFGKTLTPDQIWKVVLFLKNMDSLSPAAQKAWDAVPKN